MNCACKVKKKTIFKGKKTRKISETYNFFTSVPLKRDDY